MAVALAERILAIFEKGLSAWQTYIATRQEAYNRHKDKQQEKAIRYAEKYIDEVGGLFEFIYKKLEIPDEEKKEFEKIKKNIYKLKDKFNKYD